VRYKLNQLRMPPFFGGLSCNLSPLNKGSGGDFRGVLHSHAIRYTHEKLLRVTPEEFFMGIGDL